MDNNQSVKGIILGGDGGRLVEVECRLSNNLPTIVIVGSAGRSVSESAERIRGAFASSQILLPRKRITINLAPADLPKSDSGLDLAIAVAIIKAGFAHDSKHNTQHHKSASQNHSIYIGELGLDGSLRPVRGVIGRILAGKKLGYKTFYVPAQNADQAALIPKITVYPIGHLSDLATHIISGRSLTPVSTITSLKGLPTPPEEQIQLDDISGQERAKRALMIAAAGGHNLLLTGPPGTGKTMLAKAMIGLLPPMNIPEVLEVTQLQSLASQDFDRVISQRPFRTPHHSASRSAIIGGNSLRPGEISLAHRGVLFLDELPEYRRDVIEALRQPLEDHKILIVRARDSAKFDADFILIATANPCPCGYYGATGGKTCQCTAYQVANYASRLSGPILDRIDLYSYVDSIDHKNLLQKSDEPSQQLSYAKKISVARQLQQARNRESSKSLLNGRLSNRGVAKQAKLDQESKSLLDAAASKLHLSARAYIRTIRVARTIADLEQSNNICAVHIAEALSYRKPDTA